MGADEDRLEEGAHADEFDEADELKDIVEGSAKVAMPIEKSVALFSLSEGKLKAGISGSDDALAMPRSVGGLFTIPEDELSAVINGSEEAVGRPCPAVLLALLVEAGAAASG